MEARSVSRAKLEAAVIAAMGRAEQSPMVWGEDDCALWVAGALRDALGYDPVSWYRGRYVSRFGAMRLMAANGGLPGLLRAAARRHGWTPVDPAMAQPGDVGLAWTAHGNAHVLATVVCRAHGWFVGRNEGGWTATRAENVACAWSVLDDWQAGPRVNLHTKIPGMPQPAHEPVSAVIGLTALLEGTLLAGWGGTIISVTLSVGFSVAASLLQPQRGGIGPTNSLGDTSIAQSAQITERQPIPFKRYVVGEAFVGGALFFEQTKAPYITLGTLLSEGEIDGVRAAYIGTNLLSFSSITENTILTPLASDGQPDYTNNVRCSFRYGADDQAVDPLILSDYASIGAEFRQRGIATAVMRYHYGGTTDTIATQTAHTALYGQVPRPNAYFVIRGRHVYDPRDPTQDRNNESTWQWSNNATLVQAWYLTRSFGGRISVARIDWDKIAISADYDDSVMACADGTTIKRHTIDGVITLNQKPYQVLQDLLTANRGMVLAAGGYVWIETSKPKSPIATIHDTILASGIKYQPAKAKRDQVNKLQVRFVAPDQDYQVVDGPILNRTDLQTSDGEVLPATLALNFTQDHRRAQRLQKAFLDSSRIGATVTCSVDLSFFALPGVAAEELIGNVVTFSSSSLFSSANGDYLVTGYGYADDFSSVSLALTKYDPDIETAWNPAVDEQAFTLAEPDVS